MRTLTYLQLHREVRKFANCLTDPGVTKGDSVAIYMPVLLETVVAVLACARIGAIHNVVFGGFSPDAPADRINDSKCKVLITADGDQGVHEAGGRPAGGPRWGGRASWGDRRL